MNKQQIEDYALKFISPLDPTPGRQVAVGEGEDTWTITFKSEDDRVIRGGYIFFVHNETGDVLNMTKLGSGSYYLSLSDCVHKFYNDDSFRDLMKGFHIYMGNVKQGTFNEH